MLVGTFGITIDGPGAAPAVGVAGYVTIPYSCTISGWSLQSDQPGSITIDVLKHAGSIPNATTDKISGSAPPALSTQQLVQSGTTTGWSTAVSANDVVGFNVTAASTLTRATLVVNCSR